MRASPSLHALWRRIGSAFHRVSMRLSRLGRPRIHRRVTNLIGQSRRHRHW